MFLIASLASHSVGQGDSLRMFMGTFSSILGAIILIAIIVPYFLVPVACILTIYFYAALFYRSSARELKVCWCSFLLFVRT